MVIAPRLIKWKDERGGKIMRDIEGLGKVGDREEI